MPGTLNLLRRREVLLDNYSERSTENARRAEDDLFGIQNSRKAYLGMLAGLQDPAIIEKKRKDEKELRDAVAKDPKLSQAYGDGWDQVAATIKTLIQDSRRIQSLRHWPAETRAVLQQRSIRHRHHSWCAWPKRRQSRTASACANIPRPASIP